MPYNFEDVEAACLSTALINRAQVERMIVDLYQALDARAPSILWTRSPAEGAAVVAASRDSYPLNGLRRMLIRTTPPNVWASEWSRRQRIVRLRTRTPNFGRLAEIIVSDLIQRLPSTPVNDGWSSITWSGDTWRPFVGADDMTLSEYSYWVNRQIGTRHGHHFYETISLWSDADRLMEIGENTPLYRRAHELALMISVNVGWWWPFHNVVVLSARPETFSWDTNGRLHNATGPALRYYDGYSLYFWRGQHVPREVIDGTWSVQQMLNEPNIETRRCYIERMGWDWFIRKGELKMVGAVWPDPGNPGQILQLYEVPSKVMGTAMRLLVCDNGSLERDGTRRRFGIPVPPDVTTPLAAQAWIHDDPSHRLRMTEELYSQLQRRC